MGLREEYVDIPWNNMAGTRGRIIHDYDAADSASPGGLSGTGMTPGRGHPIRILIADDHPIVSEG